MRCYWVVLWDPKCPPVGTQALYEFKASVHEQWRGRRGLRPQPLPPLSPDWLGVQSQCFGDLNRSVLLTDCGGFGGSKVQLWWLKAASNVDPELWSQKRSDEGELGETRPRQLGGVEAMRSQTGGTVAIRSTKDFKSLSFSCCENLVYARTRELV